jgi:hypothetical protein
MLHQLKNGNWIDLAKVERVAAEPGYDNRDISPNASHAPPRVRVDFIDSKMSERCNFDTLKAAQAYRDELAKLVNEAHLAAAGKTADGRPKPMP